MLSEEYTISSAVSYNDMFMTFTQQFLHSFQEIVKNDFETGISSNFEIKGRSDKKRINPMIRLATPEDIEDIIFIYKDVYDDTYPYKEMEDREEILKMLSSPNIEWLIFETKDHEIVGCFTFMLDFNKKMGNIRGFNLKKKFLGKLDIMKMAMGSIIAMYKKYYNKIFRWYGECRTAHSKSQFFLSALGFKPVGFYPCKDVFYNKVESDLLILSYDERSLTTMRSKETPKILPEALNGFLYSDKRYNLGSYKIKHIDNLKLNKYKIRFLQRFLRKSISTDRFGYENIKFSFEDSDSYFEFLYTPTVQNFEKTHYKVDCLEELYIFIREFLNYGKELDIRYCEAFISAYEPSHQKLFHDFGLHPHGYIPSWKYNQNTEIFEDCILFNWFEGGISEDIQLLQEGQELVDMLGIRYSFEPKIVPKQISNTKPMSFKEKVSSILNSTKFVKSTIIAGYLIYFLLLFGGFGNANLNGYRITTHTISELGSLGTTQLPFLFDLSSVIGGSTSILFYYYLFKRLKVLVPHNNIIYPHLFRSATIIGIVGSFGIIFVGIFSLDRAFGSCHNISSIFAFGGFTISLLLVGIIIIKFDTEIPRMIGSFGIMPLITLILQFLIPIPLLEWMLLLSILSSIMPIVGWVTLRLA